MTKTACKGLILLFCFGLLWTVLPGSAALATEIEVVYSFRALGEGWGEPSFEEGNITATITADQPISLLYPDETFVQIGSQRFIRVFHWSETDTVSVVFIDEFDEEFPMQLFPAPRYPMEPANHTVPVIHLQTDPVNLWDVDTGIYVYGLHINWSLYGVEWERPVHFQYWDTDGSLLISRQANIRVSGGNSRCYRQKSLRLYFDHQGDPEELTFDFFGEGDEDFARILLRNCRFPYKILYDSWATTLFSDLGHEISRIKPVTVFLNGNYWGSYNLRERLDDEWLEITHGLDKDDFSMIKDGDTENGNAQSWWDFLDWVASPQDYASHDFFEQVCSNLDLSTYIDWLIINIFGATADNGFYTNLVLFKVLDDPWKFVVWDEDSLLDELNAEANMFMFFTSSNQAEFQAWRPGNYSIYSFDIAKPFFNLFNHLMQNAEFRTRFSHRFDELMDGPMTHRNLTDRLQAMADQHIPELDWHAAKYWYGNMNVLYSELDDALEWIPPRHFLVKQQKADFMQLFMAPVELSQFVASEAPDGHLLVWHTESETDCLGFQVQQAFSPDGPFTVVADYLSEPTLAGAGDFETPADYSFLVPDPGSSDAVYYRLAHTSAGGGQVVHPWVEIVGTVPPELPVLFINEFVALNTDGITDENGEYEDWVEIYNPGQQMVDLGGMFLTDDLQIDTRWTFPEGITLDAGDYLIVWCDSDEEDGPLHTSFKLSAAGEQCGLFSSVADGHELIDSVTFGAQSENISYGRMCDGCLDWTYFSQPTPAASNNLPSAVQPLPAAGLPVLSVYPNPFNPVIHVEFEMARDGVVEAVIFNPAGRLVKTLAVEIFPAGEHFLKWDGRDDGGRAMPAGVYFLSLKTDAGVVGRKITLVK